jgi:branched-chain amino acid transport system substrate-binding protein
MAGLRTRVGLGALLLLTTAALTLGAAGADGGTNAEAPIIIGAAIDMTSFMSPFDTPGVAAAKIEIAKINARGGINGRMLQLKTCDTQLKPELGKSCVAKLLDQGAAIGWVTCDVEYAAPAAQEFLNAGKLTIAPCIGTDQMGPKRFGAKGKLAFSFSNVAQDEGAAMAEYAFSRGWRTAIVVKDNLLIYFKNVDDAFAVRFKQLGGKIVGEESFTSRDNTINSVISRVNGRKADVIAFSEAFGELPQFVAGLRSLGNQTPIINGSSGDGTYWYPKNPKVTNYFYTANCSIFGDDPDARVRALLAEMQKAGVRPTTGQWLPAAGAIQAIVYGIKKTGGTDGAKIASVFERFKGFPTISGKVTFTPRYHTVIGRAYRIMSVQNNKPKFLKLFTAKKPAKID